MTKINIHEFPKSRIATIDVSEMGKRKHHVTGLIELDVTISRRDCPGFGKAAVVAMTFDPRFSLRFIGSSGAGGVKILRRNFFSAMVLLQNSFHSLICSNR